MKEVIFKVMRLVIPVLVLWNRLSIIIEHNFHRRMFFCILISKDVKMTRFRFTTI